MSETEFDFWSDRLGIQCGGYNESIDQQVFLVAQEIIDARKAEKSVFVTEIAELLDMSEHHVELIQYILASVRYPDRPHLKDCPFEYGTSPRGLFVADEECAERFMQEFREHMKQWRD